MSKSPICMAEVTLFVTNGGPHPPDKWAAVAAGQIANLIDIDEQSNSAAAANARKKKPRFALDCAEALETIFTQVTTDARVQVENGTVIERNAPIDVSSYMNAVEAAVISSAGGTPFAGHFSGQPARRAVDRIVGQFLIDAANISRSWAFDAKGL